jgi:uncharacterized lipoprotein YddW (UPF0748 family)
MGLALALPAACRAAVSSAPVVVVEGDFLGQGGESMRPRADAAARIMREALDKARVGYRVSRDSLVEKEGLPGARVCILPYNRAVSPGELTKLLEFLRSGGKVICCLVAPPELLRALPVRAGGYLPGAEGVYARVVASSTWLPGLPSTVLSPTSQIRSASAAPSSQVVATWRSAKGQDTGKPAVIVGASGVFITSTLSGSGDRVSQAALMRALCGYFAPQVWSECLPASPADLGPLGRYASLDELGARLVDRARDGEDVMAAAAQVGTATDTLALSRRSLSLGDIASALRLSEQARQEAEKAYWMSYPSVSGELRGVWATYAAPPDWDTAVRTMREANLNAVFPYVATAGAAWYPSRVVPWVENRDLLQEAVTAGNKYGVPVHARILGLYAMCAPESFKQSLQAAGRFALSAKGTTTRWLCPTNPQNRQLLVNLATEIVTRYPVSGLQLDYLRYPQEDCCLCPLCRKAFLATLGKPVADLTTEVLRKGEIRDRWLDWRREQITSLLVEIRRALRATRPDLPLSAAVFLNWEDHRDGFGQDWKVWIDRGLVDFVCPMSYTPSLSRFEMYTRRQIGWVKGRVPLCQGIGVNADGMTFGGPQNLLDQITLCRSLGLEGWVVFNYDENFATSYLPFLKLGATSSPSTFCLPDTLAAR